MKYGLNGIYEAMHGFEQTPWLAAYKLGGSMYAGEYKSLLRYIILFFTNSSDAFSPAAGGGTPIGASTIRCPKI